jgi:hypothetical protein
MIKDGVKSDDKVTIKKNFTYNDFEISYRDNNNGSPIRHTLTGFYHKRVMDYVYILLKNQYIDEEGYDKIQVNVPGMPRVIISAANLSDLYYRDHLYDTISMGLDMLENCEHVRENCEDVRENCEDVCNHNRNGTAENDYTYTYTYNTPTNSPSLRSSAPGVRPQHLFFNE